MISPRAQFGLSLIEMLITVGVMAIAIGLASPNLRTWLQNAQIRAVSESIQNGLQLARVEAVRRNLHVRFQLTSTAANGCAISATGASWVVSRDDPTGLCGSDPSETVAPRIIQAVSAADTPDIRVLSGQSVIEFSGLGRQVNPPVGNIAINISSATGGNCVAASGQMRCLRVVVSPAGQIHLCDPSLASTDSQACP